VGVPARPGCGRRRTRPVRKLRPCRWEAHPSGSWYSRRSRRMRMRYEARGETRRRVEASGETARLTRDRGQEAVGRSAWAWAWFEILGCKASKLNAKRHGDLSA
jgi:hypothetical protein